MDVERLLDSLKTTLDENDISGAVLVRFLCQCTLNEYPDKELTKKFQNLDLRLDSTLKNPGVSKELKEELDKWIPLTSPTLMFEKPNVMDPTVIDPDHLEMAIRERTLIQCLIEALKKHFNYELDPSLKKILREKDATLNKCLKKVEAILEEGELKDDMRQMGLYFEKAPKEFWWLRLEYPE